jgi:hypothetical protein
MKLFDIINNKFILTKLNITNIINDFGYTWIEYEISRVNIDKYSSCVIGWIKLDKLNESILKHINELH